MGRVLVVDDEEYMREILASVLSASGFDVIKAGDGLEALEQFQGQGEPISLVVMDIAMPRMDGLEATKRIKEIRPSTKVVLISGNDRPPANSVADGFLAKPFRIDELCAAVQSILSDDKPRPRVA
jgi:CheY-like chemotaxis protein